MKRIFLTLLACIVLSSCESKVDQLATCYRDINTFAVKSSEYIIEIIGAWEDAENGYNRGYQDSHFDSDFNEINENTDWEWIYKNFKSAEKTINKHFPKKYQAAQKDILRLFNVARDVRSLAKSVTKDSDWKDDYDTFYDKYAELCYKFKDIRDDIEREHPEIPGALHSADELFQ